MTEQTMTVAEWLNIINGLTLAQYEKVKTGVIQKIKDGLTEPEAPNDDNIYKLIGNRPTLEDFQRSYRSGQMVLAILAGIVFTAAFVISAQHIWVFMGRVAYSTYHTVEGSLSIPPLMWALTHQIGMLFLAEASLILFMVLYNLNQDDEEENAWRFIYLAFAAAIFVLLANLSSVRFGELNTFGDWILLAFNLFIAFLPPAFTMGIGLYLEGLIVGYMANVKESQEKYYKALDQWERYFKATKQDNEDDYRASMKNYMNAQENPETDKRYIPLMRQALWEQIMRVKDNSQYGEAPRQIKLAVVQRELERDTWIHEEEQPDPKALSPYGQFSTNGHGAAITN